MSFSFQLFFKTQLGQLSVFHQERCVDAKLSRLLFKIRYCCCCCYAAAAVDTAAEAAELGV